MAMVRASFPAPALCGGASLAAALCLLAVPAWAQQADAGASCTDLVQLKNGGFVRGTISEQIPGDHVTVITASGETMRFAGDEVERVEPCKAQPREGEQSAQPASASKESQPLIVVRGPGAALRLEASRPDVTFMVMTREAHSMSVLAEGYDRMCTAPCEATLPPGTYQLALSINDDGDMESITIEEPVRITGPGVLGAEYEDASGLRTAGYVTLAAGGGGGALLLAAGIAGGALENGEGFPIWSAVIGTAITVVSLVTGSVLALSDDDATVRFTPVANP